jgi:hypothetical protein
VGDYAPRVVSISDLTDGASAAEGWTSMLVRVEDVEVVETNADAPKDYDETRLTGGLRLDDALLTELDNTYAPGQRFDAVQGILGFSFGHHKLWPRAPGDLAVP